MKKVAFAIVQSPETGKVLFLKRVKYPFGWGLVGGKLDKDEHHLSAMLRETYEETGLVVMPESHRYLGEVQLTPNTLAYVYRVYAKEFQPVLAEREHSDFCWIDEWEDADLAGKVSDMLDLLNIMK